MTKHLYIGSLNDAIILKTYISTGNSLDVSILLTWL